MGISFNRAVTALLVQLGVYCPADPAIVKDKRELVRNVLRGSSKHLNTIIVSGIIRLRDVRKQATARQCTE